MNTNQDRKNNQIFETVNDFFSKKMNKAHIRLICLLITALCKAKTVCYGALAHCFDSLAKSDSCLRRIQRFFAEFDLSHDLIARFLYTLLPTKGKKVLLIDRTNWKFGQTDINIFMLAIAHEGVAYPLMFTMLPKRGNSNSLERIALLQRYVNLFGADSIDCLLADREFVGEKWIGWLNDNRIRYHIRIKENFWVDNPRRGDRAKAHWMFQGLKVGQRMCLPGIHYIKGQACYLSASRVKGRDGTPELQVIVSFNRPDEAVETYRRRWEVETMFRALKSAGFNIEDTHLTDLQRIEKLLLIVMIAFVWCYDVGEYVHRNIREITVKTHGRKAKSIFRYGLDIVTEFLIRDRNDYNIPIPAFLSTYNPLKNSA